jgi:DinB superfamily
VTPQQREIRDRVAAVPGELAAAARGASPEPPAPGEWPPADIVRHLIAVEAEVWHPRLRQLIDEDEPIWAWVEPDRWQGSPDASLDALLADYGARRAVTVGMLDDLGDAGWAKTGVHATFGRLDAAGLMRRALDHDREHIASLEG